jgi:serine/threonine protein kinase
MHPGDPLDGYTVLRLIGSGGYGEVWLCRSDAVGDLRALKFIAASGPELLEKEFGAIGNYRRAAARLRSPHLMPVEHVGRTVDGLYYVMPLADGTGGSDPIDPDWQPRTLATLIVERASHDAWFTSGEIADLMSPVLGALQTLADAGLVHRDVKPDNILFFAGQPCLADISLLDADSATLTRRGTPGYVTPSWYIGGHPDMYGAAATLYTLLTGNPPDRMGRGAYTAPPQGLGSLTPHELAGHKRLHGVIRRATDERVTERYPNFLAMAEALVAEPRKQVRGNRLLWLGVLWLMVTSTVALVALCSKHHQPANEPAEHKQAREIAGDILSDGNLAYNSLSAFVGNEFNENVSSAENDFYWTSLARMQPYSCYPENLDFPAAIRILDEIIEVIPNLGKQPGVVLPRLLLLQCSGETAQVEREVENPALLVPLVKGDEPYYRSQILCRLHRPDKAEELLDKVIAMPNLATRKLTKALQYRAGTHVRQNKFTEAAMDATKALELVEGQPIEKAELRRGLADIEKEFPRYAEYLREHPMKK